MKCKMQTQGLLLHKFVPGGCLSILPGLRPFANRTDEQHVCLYLHAGVDATSPRVVSHSCQTPHEILKHVVRLEHDQLHQSYELLLNLYRGLFSLQNSYWNRVIVTESGSIKTFLKVNLYLYSKIHYTPWYYCIVTKEGRDWGHKKRGGSVGSFMKTQDCS